MRLSVSSHGKRTRGGKFRQFIRAEVSIVRRGSCQVNQRIPLPNDGMESLWWSIDNSAGRVPDGACHDAATFAQSGDLTRRSKEMQQGN